MSQLVTRIDDDLAAELDRLVTDGFVDSRSDAVRRGLHQLIDQHRRQRIGNAIREGYEREPQTDTEAEWSDSASISMIAEEPW